jgi:xanthine dehydrogenase small subunit
VSKRTYLDIASVNSAIKIEVVEHDGMTEILRATVSAGGVAPFPLYLEKTSKYLTGKKFYTEMARDPGTGEHTAHIALGAADTAAAECSPISDIRGSTEYKQLLLRQLILAHFSTLFPGLTEKALLEALRSEEAL